MPPKLSQYSPSPMPTPPSSPDEEEENATFDPSEKGNNNNITSALDNKDIEDDNDSNESDEDDNNNNNENNETITNLQASFQLRITILTQTLNRLNARTLAIRYQRLHFQTNPTASLSIQVTQGENTNQTHLAVLRLREKIIEREIGEVKAQMQALRAGIDAAVQSSDDDDNDNDNDDGDEIMEEDEEMQECNHEHNTDDGDGATMKEIVEVDEDW
ncbi:hypothetical protein D6D02_08746 [Aureobasidium pullulans]|nr:hypothetical protein D6D02_08746 [Aureobasidium pullulans]